MSSPTIKPFEGRKPVIYAYTTPDVSTNEGWLKIGYTDRDADTRIKEQTQTVGVDYIKHWVRTAMFDDDTYEFFDDHAFHRYLEFKRNVERRRPSEWFRIDPDTADDYLADFKRRKYDMPNEGAKDYILRSEQQRAVDITKAHFEAGGEKFLWNAKPRFGKTLTAYHLVREMGFKRVLVVSNRPSISNSWALDFRTFIQGKTALSFVSDNDELRSEQGVLSREEYIEMMRTSPGREKGFIAFESLQGIKGAEVFGGHIPKLEWMSKIEFDLLIVDEAQEGVETRLTEVAFSKIKRKYTLYLSGTPFKQLASDNFSDNEIFNWSYADEQEAKAAWTGEEHNPYDSLPQLQMFTYQISKMTLNQIQHGATFDDEGVSEYAFDLNEFFRSSDNLDFLHEDDVKAFLDALTTNERYPFSTEELRNNMRHTMWHFDRVNSAKAMAKLLKKHEVFSEYEIVVAAGDGYVEGVNERANKTSFAKVQDAIKNHDKTITLTVGQLTVGVTIPEWSGVLMLSNMKSASSYMQAAFRVQNPHSFNVGNKFFKKEVAYVFDFDPARTLIMFDEFANNLSRHTAEGRGTQADREENIRRLLNFFPVLGEDTEGQMVQLDEKAVLSIPRKIKSAEVVRRGFMSNYLFQNITNLFSASSVMQNIITKMEPAKEERLSEKKQEEKKEKALHAMDNLELNEYGEVDVDNERIIGLHQDVFGQAKYENSKRRVSSFNNTVEDEAPLGGLGDMVKELGKDLSHICSQETIGVCSSHYGDLSKRDEGNAKKAVEKTLKHEFEKVALEVSIEEKKITRNYERKFNAAENEAQREDITREYHNVMHDFSLSVKDRVNEEAIETRKKAEMAAMERIEEGRQEAYKKRSEDYVRDHLRGFARTIPSFLMAYGTKDTTLANFDVNIDDDVFKEVTGIESFEFRLLRDGGEYKGEYLEGHLFDEVVFNDAIQEFLNKRSELANYFDEDNEEDIFNYIPPQRTNQIFTPKNVVKQMVDALEKENPGCFENPDFTFADLYMKSGLYITEIVKRLFTSEGLRRTFPDKKERIEHILSKQMYGMAPTRIIYLISTNYIFGFDEALKKKLLESNKPHFVEVDAATAAKEGKLENLVEECFG